MAGSRTLILIVALKTTHAGDRELQSSDWGEIVLLTIACRALAVGLSAEPEPCECGQRGESRSILKLDWGRASTTVNLNKIGLPSEGSPVGICRDQCAQPQVPDDMEGITLKKKEERIRWGIRRIEFKGEPKTASTFIGSSATFVATGGLPPSLSRGSGRFSISSRKTVKSALLQVSILRERIFSGPASTPSHFVEIYYRVGIRLKSAGWDLGELNEDEEPSTSAQLNSQAGAAQSPFEKFGVR
ncbi:hypothetical protein B0H17DRAFT_1125729 [Mycena rosella]|uniref:Uncharacterized protein n=1 Tax=Mycena rosella TaxID=1033263 RepID=A0AAD7GX19_MYCRO|nr:hypothetical protein B0H17DRAFT_1125729 [Mycena rosella]